MTQRLFTETELDATCLPSAERIRAALINGDKDYVKVAYNNTDAAFREVDQNGSARQRGPSQRASDLALADRLF